MVEEHLALRGIRAPRVLEAFRAIAREEFLPREISRHAYIDAPLPIGEGQTISQPFIVAYTVEALSLRGTERVLDGSWRSADGWSFRWASSPRASG